MSVDEITKEIAAEIAADATRANLERCLQRVRQNGAALATTLERMDRTIYDLTRAREMTEAVAETNREIEGRIHLLIGAARD